MIELACGRPEISQLATLGHELFHAIEIAEEPTVVNPVTLADSYSRIGIETSDSGMAMELELIVYRIREELRRASIKLD